MTKLMTIDSVLVRDFSKFGLLPSLLSLSSTMQTSSTACDCIRIPQGVATYDGPVMGKLYMATLTNEEFGEAFALGTAFKGLTCDDTTVLYLARRDGTILITGDSLIYRVAASLNITVHNYQWAFGEMVEAGILSKAEAKDKYNLLATSVNKLTDWKEPAHALKEAYTDYEQVLNYVKR
jgi:hypothetical protein